MRSLIIFTYLITGTLTLSVISATQSLEWDNVKNAPTSLYYPSYKIICGFLMLLTSAFFVTRSRIASGMGLICLLALSGWWYEIVSGFQNSLEQMLRAAQSVDFLSGGIRILSVQFLFTGILGYFAAIALSFLLLMNLKPEELKFK